MRDTETYKEFANECERIARTMTGEHRKSLLTIAEAWREFAREAERRSESRSCSEDGWNALDADHRCSAGRRCSGHLAITPTRGIS
jgi:hypothetical protein